jgi:hypothetical protein
MEVEGLLQGAPTLGKPLQVRLNLALPGAAPLTRSFEFAVGPTLVWSAKMLGPVQACPLVTEFDDSHETRVVACSTAGEIVCLDTAGNLLWTKVFPSVFTSSPVVGRHWNGSRHIAVADQQGKVRILKPNGTLRWEFSFEQPCSRSGLSFANLHAFPGDEVVAGLQDGRVCAVINDGFPYWTHAMEGRNALVALLPPGDDGFCAVVAASDAGDVVCLEHDGAPRWTARADAPLDCPPLVMDYAGKGTLAVITASRKGAVKVWDAKTGAPLFKAAPNGFAKPLFLTEASHSPADKLAFLTGDGASLRGLSHEFEVLWQTPLPCAAPPAIALIDNEPRILACATKGAPTHSDKSAAILWNDSATDGALTCLDKTGAILWTDTRPAGPPLSAPRIIQGGATNTQCLYTSTDGLLRTIALNEPKSH